MSIFASQTTGTVTVGGGSVTIRKLTGREVEKAQAAHLAGFMGRSSRGWADAFQRTLASGTASAEDVKKLIADPLNGYDRATVLKAGIVSWTFGDVTPAAVDDLDDEASDTIGRAVMALTKPAKEAGDADRKNA